MEPNRAEPVTSTEPLVGFLYDLMRDHLPCGIVEQLVCESVPIGEDNPCVFTNGYLAEYAKELAERLSPTVPR